MELCMTSQVWLLRFCCRFLNYLFCTFDSLAIIVIMKIFPEQSIWGFISLLYMESMSSLRLGNICANILFLCLYLFSFGCPGVAPRILNTLFIIFPFCKNVAFQKSCLEVPVPFLMLYIGCCWGFQLTGWWMDWFFWCMKHYKTSISLMNFYS